VSKQVTIVNVTSEFFTDNEALVTPMVDIRVNGTYETANVTLRYDPAKVSDPTNITLCCWNETYGFYEPLDSVVDTTNHTITASVPHFSLFGGFFVPLINQMFNRAAQINKAATILFNNAADTIKITVRNTVNIVVKNIQNGQPTTRQYTLPTYQVTSTPTPTPIPTPIPTPTPMPTATPLPTPFPIYVPPPVPSDSFKEPYVYVSNSNVNIVSVVNTYDNSIVASIPTGARPGEIAISSDGNRVYVSNDNRVSVIDTRTNQVIYDIPFHYGTGFLALSPDNSRLYVANNGGISCIDLSNTQEIGRINGLPNIAGMDISKDGNYIFTSDYWGCSVDVSSTSSFTKIKTIRCYPDSSYQYQYNWNGYLVWNCGVATSVSTSHDGEHVYVSLWTSNDMSIINAQTLTRENTITLGYRSSDGVTVSPDDHVVYATNFDSGSISVVNADTQALAYSIPVGTHPRRIDASHDGKYVFVCLEGGYVKSVDRLKGNTVSTIPIYGNSVRANPARNTVWPSIVDSDGDGLPDDVEKQFVDLHSKIVYHSDPANQDTDYDGLTDKQEAGTKAVCYIILNDVGYFYVVANPQLQDSDSDSLYDADELDLGIKPLISDSDEDGLNDGRELKYFTDPMEANTDGDDYTDTFEIYNGFQGGYPVSDQPNPNPVPLPPDYNSRIRYDIMPSQFLGDPVVYEERSFSNEEMFYEFQQGAEYGDYRERVPDHLEHDNLYYLLGQIASSVAGIGDPRDVNAGWDHHDYVSMVINGIGLVPGLGDAAKLGAKYISRQLVMGAEESAFEAFSKGLKKSVSEAGSREAELTALRSTVDDETLSVLKKSFTEEELVDIVKNSDLDIVYLRMVMDDADALKDCPKFAEYVKYVFKESGNSGMQKWLSKNIKGIGSINAKMKRINAAGGTVSDSLKARKLGYINNLKGAHGEYRAFTDLLSKYGPVEGLALKMPNSGGPDFIFKVTEGGQTYIKIVEVKARKTLSIEDIRNYILKNNRDYNINYGTMHKNTDYFRDTSGNGLPIQFDLYIYGDNSESLANNILSNLPADKKLLYSYHKKVGAASYVTFNGEATVNVIHGGLG
jgi:YVTN family beta-propeller protein